MKKHWVWLATLLMGLLVLGSACGNQVTKKSQINDVDTILKPGTVWKEKVGGRWHKLKVIDETTWEYSKEMNPEPVQMTVKRKKDYQGLEHYEIVDSAGIQLFIGEEALIIPYDKDGIKTVKFIPTHEEEHRTKQELMKEYSGKTGYKLQKTGE